MKKLLALAFACLLASTISALAASSGPISIIVGSTPSTSVTCTPGTLTAPVAVGATICPIAVLPAGWTGALTLSGTNAGLFGISGTNLVVGSTALAAGTYSVIVTATP